MDEYLRFENAIFCSSNCNFFEIFCSQPVFTTEFFTFFIFNDVLTTVNTTLCMLIKYLPTKFNVMFKFNYSKYNPRGLIFGGELIHERSFLFVPKRPGAYTQWGLLSEFYGRLDKIKINK